MFITVCINCWAVKKENDTSWECCKDGSVDYHNCTLDEKYIGMGIPIELPDDVEPKFISGNIMGCPIYDPNGLKRRPNYNKPTRAKNASTKYENL